MKRWNGKVSDSNDWPVDVASISHFNTKSRWKADEEEEKWKKKKFSSVEFFKFILTTQYTHISYNRRGIRHHRRRHFHTANNHIVVSRYCVWILATVLITCYANCEVQIVCVYSLLGDDAVTAMYYELNICCYFCYQIFIFRMCFRCARELQRQAKLIFFSRIRCDTASRWKVYLLLRQMGCEKNSFFNAWVARL